ncbi:lasso peptide biosynthesis PqqD family chaperone [Paenibacillus rhizovicinus]|uniref:Lasso peptide biosynthesis PqqD family chaperone n=2 Tax=Paenibacillus rhizovicinus TaxID=2704463 RepID=A0A6C0P9C1_9BACL|nr:lasso peptide biosynthesis PqqD family chaperone [Paenibacillus rhizovicinus]
MSAERFHVKDRIVRSNELLASDMNGEKVLMSVKNGKYYNLGTIGGRIWELIERPASMERIVETLLEEFSVDESACLAQVTAFMTHLHRESLVQRFDVDSE